MNPMKPTLMHINESDGPRK